MQVLIIFGNALGAGLRQQFNIVQDLVDGPDFHGILFFSPGKLRAEQNFYFP
jgi:hypothetical protein